MHLFALIAMTPPAASWLPADFRDSSEFELRKPSLNKNQSQVVVRLRDKAHITFTCLDVQGLKRTEEVRFAVEGENFVRTPRDGYPFTPEYYSNWTELSGFAWAMTQSDMVKVSISGEYHREGVRRWTDRLPFGEEAAWIEALTRKTLSSWAARRLNSQAISIVMDGGVVKAWRTEGGEPLADLADLSQKAGFSLHQSEDSTRIAFTFRGQDYIVPLGASKVKRGTTWLDLPDVIMLKEGRFLVPCRAFE